MQDDVSVEPSLREAGEIGSLVPLLEEGDARPIRPETSEQYVPGLKDFQTSVEAAAKLGVAVTRRARTP